MTLSLVWLQVMISQKITYLQCYSVRTIQEALSGSRLKMSRFSNFTNDDGGIFGYG